MIVKALALVVEVGGEIRRGPCRRCGKKWACKIFG